MELSDKFYKSIIAEAMDEFAMLEKGGKDHPEDDNDHKKQGQKDTVSKSDQQIIRRKVKNKQGRNIINVTAIADELPYTQSMINRCINGKVHNGSQGEVEYKMPTDMARGIEAYLKRQVAEGKVASIMKQVLKEWSESNDNYTTVTVPDFCLPYLVNGDQEGYSDDEIAAMQDFEANWNGELANGLSIGDVCVPNEDERPSFCSKNDVFGNLGCDCYTFRVPLA